MSDDRRETHRTASIRRTRRPQTATPPSASTLRSELTSAIPRDKRLVTGRWRRLIGALGLVAVLAALFFVLFVSPVRTWLRQRDDIAQRQHELDVVRTANAALEVELARLRSAEGQAAVVREELGYVARGEEQWNMTLSPGVSLTLPSGWPYDHVRQILRFRGVATPAASPVDPTQP